MASGSVVAALPPAAMRSAGFRAAGLEVLSVLRAGMAVSCTSGSIGRTHRHSPANARTIAADLREPKARLPQVQCPVRPDPFVTIQKTRATELEGSFDEEVPVCVKVMHRMPEVGS